MMKIILQKESIDIQKFLLNFNADEDGAIVTFIGKVRNNSNDKEVKYIEYDIYEGMAKSELETIANYAFSKWNISNCQIIHRFGRVMVGEVSIIIVVSSPHREEAYESSRYIIDTIKKKVPIWKKEVYTNGSNWISHVS